MNEKYVSRAGEKLAHALKEFNIDVKDKTCADLGCSTGGFTDCLLQHGAKKVYAIDTGYGVLDWKLRNDPRVIVMERTNALHATLPEKVDVVTVDVGWTKQQLIIPAAVKMIKEHGSIISLVKPHYEADSPKLVDGKLPESESEAIQNRVVEALKGSGISVESVTKSPIVGKKGGNIEFLLRITH